VRGIIDKADNIKDTKFYKILKKAVDDNKKKRLLDPFETWSMAWDECKYWLRSFVKRNEQEIDKLLATADDDEC